jgi:hypothetical protein
MPTSLQARQADQATRAAQSEGDVNANTHDLVQGTHVEGHIAFLKTELQITAEQEQLWDAVADAMREDVKNITQADEHMRHMRGPDNALDYLSQRAAFANLRAQGEAQFLAAFRPLYLSLSAQQKRTADSILIPDMDE